MKDLATAYSMKRRMDVHANKKLKPQVEPAKMAMGGEVKEAKCMHCGGMYNPDLHESKMAEGGMVEDEHIEVDGDVDMDDHQGPPRVGNQLGDPDHSFEVDMEDSEKEVKPSGMLLSKILNGLRRAHSGKA